MMKTEVAIAISGWILILLLIVLCIFVGNHIYRAIKITKKTVKFRENIKEGDIVDIAGLYYHKW